MSRSRQYGQYFNSRPREGANFGVLYTLIDEVDYFNSRPREGANPALAQVSHRSVDFNSRPREGANDDYYEQIP